MYNYILLLFVFCSFSTIKAQEKQYKIGAIGFYNLENLFDLEDDTLTRDDDFTPNGALRYTPKIYKEKLDHLAQVVVELGTELTPDGIAILGVSEIENRKVLEDFVQHPLLKQRNYQIVHFDSPDKRGIDVGLIYQPKYFTPTFSKAIDLTTLKSKGDTLFTRDILWVGGQYDGEELHVLVNHWPSRRGGEQETQQYRNLAAFHNKQIVDSLRSVNPNAKVIIMGDLNDDPNSPSCREVLQAEAKKSKASKSGLYNPMYAFYKKGLGTTAYQGAWSLFDQIILTDGFLDKDGAGYQLYKAKVHNPKYLIQKKGTWKGYPFRTFSGGKYIGGYSDHFPVYVYLVKAI